MTAQSLAHLPENDLWGGLTLIDKVRAVCEAHKLFAEELGLDEISQRRLETELRRAGYRITQARISQMVYTVHRLLPVIPIALEGGLGRPDVEGIRRMACTENPSTPRPPSPCIPMSLTN
ncbi:MAG: hypothetical protein N0E48_24685 [Candidatus Thiodiazotropha endolucinida]|nr:hypothetical protein [Candidatus Thiodiazotropha taylori]MCW4346525.1 hypothetical protein [Candidatus Thiodiazotropha endolucinida]